MSPTHILYLCILAIALTLGGIPPTAAAGGKSAAIVAGSRAVGARLSRLVGRHVDDATVVPSRVARTGVLNGIEQVGTDAPHVVKLFAQHGDEAVWIVSKPRRLAIFVRHGDDAATALLKHRDLATTLITRHGQPAAKALSGVSVRNGRRLAMMSSEGVFEATPRSKQLWQVITTHGDAAADFIWRNKGALSVVATLTLFLNDPQSFISGSVDLATATQDKVFEALPRILPNGSQSIARCAFAGIIVAAALLCRGILLRVWRFRLVRWILSSKYFDGVTRHSLNRRLRKRSHG